MIGLLAFGGAVVGFVLQQLVAFYFGASAATDAYFMAFSTSELLGKILLGGSITAIFLPIFLQHLTSGKRQEAWRLALNVFHVSAGILLLLICLLAIFTEPFARFIAPGFDAATIQLTVQLLRVLLPAFFFYFLSDLAVSMLHALKLFFVPALLRVVAPLVPIVMVLLFTSSLHIFALALGTTVSAALQFLVVALALRRQGLQYRVVFDLKDPALRRIVYLAYPFIFSMVVTQVAGIAYRVLVSDLTVGSLSALKYAEKITQLLTIIFLNSVTTVIYPLLAAKVSQGDLKSVRETVAGALRLTTFLTVPLIIGIVFLHQDIITFVYAHGLFSQTAVALTSSALVFLALGLTTTALSSILGHTVLAFQKSRAAVAITIVSQAVALYLFVLLVPRYGHNGLALASSLVPLSSGLLYFLYLNRLIPRFRTIFWQGLYPKLAVLSLLLIAVLYTTQYTIRPYAEGALFIGTLLNLIVPTVLGAAVFLGTAYAWQISEVHDLKIIAVRILGKWRRSPIRHV